MTQLYLLYLLSSIESINSQITQTFTNSNGGNSFINGAKVVVLESHNVINLISGWQINVVNDDEG